MLRNLLLLWTFFVFPVISALTAPTCKRHCGNRSHVPYPFGFSDGCEILLDCDEGTGEISIGNFMVHNVTQDSLLIHLEAKCNRTIQTLSKLFGPNYAMTWQNGLLLRNCTSPKFGCILPSAPLAKRFNLTSCGSSDNTTCFSREDKAYMRFENLTQLKCAYLYSSFAVDASKIPAVSLEFEMVELGWWVSGNCSCARHANCTEVVSPVDGRPGFRCRCNKGFEGDGFNDGKGCHKVSTNCNPSRYMSGHCGGTKRVAVLIGGSIFAGASIMAGLAFLCCFIRRRSTSMKARRSTRRLLCEAAGSCTIPFHPYKEIERATNYFCEKQRLGTGAYGTVYAGRLHNDEWVAIKKIKHHDNDGIEQVMNEIKLLSSVSHPNLVRLLGCCIERGEQILVYEFMPNGTLSQHLQREKGNGLPWTVRLNISVETAKAIAHLHSSINPPIYHRDIKSSNILLDCNFNSKVADFGLSRLGMMTESSHISTAPQGTPGYLDPQYHQNFHLSDKSDVYSFGVVLLEIISSLKVVDFNRPQSEVNLASLAIDRIGKGCVDEIIDPFLEPHRDAWTLSSVHKVAELAFRCLAFHRDMRPSMMEVAAELEHIKLSGWTQMDGSMCLASSASFCSSPENTSEISQTTTNKTVSVNRMVVVPQRSEFVVSGEDSNSPVSVQDPWFSDQSSPSTNSLLGNVVH